MRASRAYRLMRTVASGTYSGAMAPADAELQARRPAVVGVFALGDAHRPLQQPLVEAGADQTHVPGLLVADQVAAAAQVQVAGADGEAGAEPVEGLERRQARAASASLSSSAGSVSR